MGRKPVHLEGTTLEGGGQLLRIALGLSSLTKIPINVINIRGKRSGGGGLKAQHLTSLQWLAHATNATLSGAVLKSKEIDFAPSKSSNVGYANNTHVNITQSTPGSINLVFQAILPYLLFSKSEESFRVRISGGTNVFNSPSYDYIEHVLLPILAKIGIPSITVEMHARGWSQGSLRIGSVTFTVNPLQNKLPAFQLTNRGEIQAIKAIILAPKATESTFRDELEVMFDKRRTHIFGNQEPDIDISFENSHHEKRYYLLLVAITTTGMRLGRDWLYDHSFRAGKVDQIIASMVKKVSNDLISEIEQRGCVDEYLRDQLVVFQALADGKSEIDGGEKSGKLVQPSLHAKTAQWVVKEMLGVEYDDKGSCKGIGFDAHETQPSAAEMMEADIARGMGNLSLHINED